MTNLRNSFFLNSLGSLPHHIALSISYKSHIINAERFLNNKAKNRLLIRTDLFKFSENELEVYENYYSQAVAWHGTGRYQYRANEVFDSFLQIINDSALGPSNDVYSIFMTGKTMQSLSATRLRIIARSYADTHGSGIEEKNRYGSSLFWASYYYSWFYLRFFTIDIFRVINNWQAWKKHASNQNGEIVWGKKVNTKARGVWDTFTIGSDITGNFPIIFAIKKDTEQHELPGPYTKYEIRYAGNVPLTSISHIEVPIDKLKEASDILLASGIKIKLLPIELGEYYSSKLKFSANLGYE